jgi:Domain of unknown function (DUF6430)
MPTFMTNGHFKVVKAVLSSLKKWGSIRGIFAFAGVASAISGLLQFIWPDAPSKLGPWVAVGALLIAATGFVIWTSRNSCLSATASSRDWTVEIQVGDIFERPRVGVTADRRFTTDREAIGPTSLLAQLMIRLDKTEAANARTRFQDAAVGGDVQPGTTVAVESRGQSVLVVAVSQQTANGSQTSWPELWASYDGLWSGVRSRNFADFAVPVIGAGFAGASLDRKSVLGSLLLSFHAASIERIVCPKLRIMLPPDDVGLVLDAAQLLQAIGYSTQRRRTLAG